MRAFLFLGFFYQYMVVGSILEGLLAVIGSAIFWFIPLAVVIIIGLFIFNYIQRQRNWKWIGTSTATIFVMMFILLFGFNLSVIISANEQTNVEQIPLELRENPNYEETSPFALAGIAFVKSILGGVVLTVLLMPFAFLGMATFESLKKRIKGVWPRIFITSFIWAAVGSLLLLWFPWILAGLIYLVFFAL
jgi:hypothetical protein